MATYFGANYGQFLMAVSFVMARILRSNKVDETWCELLEMFLCLFMYCFPTGIHFPFGCTFSKLSKKLFI